MIHNENSFSMHIHEDLCCVSIEHGKSVCLSNTHMIYSITHNITVQQSVVASSGSEALAKANATFLEFYHQGEAFKKGLVIGGSAEPSTVHSIENGKIVLVGHDDNGDFIPYSKFKSKNN